MDVWIFLSVAKWLRSFLSSEDAISSVHHQTPTANTLLVYCTVLT